MHSISSLSIIEPSNINSSFSLTKVLNALIIVVRVQVKLINNPYKIFTISSAVESAGYSTLILTPLSEPLPIICIKLVFSFSSIIASE